MAWFDFCFTTVNEVDGIIVPVLEMKMTGTLGPLNTRAFLFYAEVLKKNKAMP